MYSIVTYPTTYRTKLYSISSILFVQFQTVLHFLYFVYSIYLYLLAVPDCTVMEILIYSIVTYPIIYRTKLYLINSILFIQFIYTH